MACNREFIYACKNDYPEIVHRLVQNGIDIETKDNLQLTGFIHACSKKMSSAGQSVLPALIGSRVLDTGLPLGVFLAG